MEKKYFLISYELNNTTKDYSIFYNSLKLLGEWWHYLPFVWIVKTNLTGEETSDKLLSFIDIDSDHLFIVEIKKSNKYGWLPKKAWEWLEKE